MRMIGVVFLAGGCWAVAICGIYAVLNGLTPGLFLATITGAFCMAFGSFILWCTHDL